MGGKGACAACAPDAEIPALLRMGALEALGDRLDLEQGALSFTRHGVRVPLRANATGHYILSVVEFGKRPRIASSRLSRNGRICLIEDCICRLWRVGFFVLFAPNFFRLVQQ